MYEWVVFVHVASVLAFMLAHGIHVTAMWAMRREPDPERMLTFLNDLPRPRGCGHPAGRRAQRGDRRLHGLVVGERLDLDLPGLLTDRRRDVAARGEFYSLVEEAAAAAIAARSTDPSKPGSAGCVRRRPTQLADASPLRHRPGRRGRHPVADDVQAVLTACERP